MIKFVADRSEAAKPEVEAANQKAREFAEESFRKITEFLMLHYPNREEETPEEAAGLIIAIGAVFETFLRAGKEHGAIDEDAARVLRHNAKVIADSINLNDYIEPQPNVPGAKA